MNRQKTHIELLEEETKGVRFVAENKVQERREYLLTKNQVKEVSLPNEKEPRLICTSHRAIRRMKEGLVIVNKKDILGKQIPYVHLDGKLVTDPAKKNREYYKWNMTRHDLNYTLLLDEEDIDESFRGIRETLSKEMAAEGIVGEDKREDEEQEGLFAQDLDKYAHLFDGNEMRKNEELEMNRVKKEQALVACPVKERRIDKMDIKKLHTYLAHHIRAQDDTMKEIVFKLLSLKHPLHTHNNSAAGRIVMITIAGSTGIGKSELVNPIRNVCYMGEGDELEKCFIGLRFGAYQDQSHGNLISGVGPGYAGFGSPCLVDFLVDALEHMQNCPLKPVIKVIMIFIDELDKGSPAMLNALNSLLDTGYLKSSTGKVFSLPADTYLLVYATCNYATNYFNNLAIGKRSPGSAYREIIKDMKLKGVADCDIGRMGSIVSFFPVSKEDATKILQFKLSEEIATGRMLFIGRMGVSMSFSASDQKKFVDYLMGDYVIKLGIRPLVVKLKMLLDMVKIFVHQHVETFYRPLIYPSPPAERPLLIFDISSSAYDSFEQVTTNPLLRAAMETDYNKDTIKVCIEQKCPIALFVFDHEYFTHAKRRCVHILDPTYYNTSEKQEEEDLVSNDEKENPSSPEQSSLIDAKEPYDAASSGTSLSTECENNGTMFVNTLVEKKQQEIEMPLEEKNKRKLDEVDTLSKMDVEEEKTSSSCGSEESSSSSHENKKRKIEVEQAHMWVVDKTYSTKVTKVYRCDCGGNTKPHYYRSCSKGKDCIGDGKRWGSSRGPCASCAKK